MDEQLVNRIAEILGQSGGAIVSEYIVWHVASALIWVGIATTTFVIAFRWKIPAAKDQYESPPRSFWVGLRIAVLCVMVIIGGCHAPDLVAPKAISIHQLLIDIRG